MKTNQLLKLSLSCCLLLLFSCTRNVQDTKAPVPNIKEGPLTFDIANTFSSKKEIKLSEVGTQVQYIQLETNKDALLSDIDKIVIDDNIYIKSKSTLYVFSLDGKFIRQIGVRGRGPNEYTSLIDFSLGKEEIATLDVLIHKIHQYSKDGSYKGSIHYSVSGPVDKLYSSDSLYYLLNSTRPDFWKVEDTGILINIYDQKGTLLPPLKNNNEMASYCVNSYKFNNMLHFQQSMNDTIFSLSGNKALPQYIINLGKYKPKAAISNANEAINTMSFHIVNETDRYIFIKIREPNLTNAFAIYDKTTNELKFLSEDSLVNDFDDNNPFWPEHISNNTLIKTLSYITMSELEDSKKLSPRLKTIYEKMDLNDNPVLMLVKLKE